MPDAVRAAVVLLAAGSGSRVGAGRNKVLLPMAGMPVLAWSLQAVRGLVYGGPLVVVHRPDEHHLVEDVVSGHAADLAAQLVPGGASRHESEWNALQSLADLIDDGRVDVVAIHDTARPLAPVEIFQAVIQEAHEHGGALPVRPQPGLLPREPGSPVADTGLVGVQTPQAFRAGPLLDAYRRAAADGFEGTDTASCVERYTDLTIRAVDSAATNIKVTFAEDVVLAERLARHGATPQNRALPVGTPPDGRTTHAGTAVLLGSDHPLAGVGLGGVVLRDRARAALRAGGLEVLPASTAWTRLAETGRPVLVHDLLCPLTPTAFLTELLSRVRDEVLVGSRPVTDTVKVVADGVVGATVDRSALVAVTAPVVLPPTVAVDLAIEASDLPALVQALRAAGHPVRFVEAPPASRRVADETDVALLAALT